MFIIAKYWMGDNEDYCETEVVPQSWYCNSSKKCCWPPTSTSQAEIKKLITKSVEYDEKNWLSYPAECIATFSKYCCN